MPVYRTTAYNFKSSQHGADLFALREPGNIYARLMNPTNDVLEKRLAQLDGGAAALTLSSGTAAIYFAVTNILRQGDELVSANNLYGGTFTQFDAILPQQGITVRFVPVNDFAATEAAIIDKTRALYIETVGKPALDVAALQLPVLGQHVDAGNFDWTDPKFSLYNEPDRGYHGLRFAHDLGELNPLAFILRLRTVGLRNQGPTLAPDAAWLFLQGVESLPLRMERHSSNARKVAEFLKHHPKVAWVRYPGLSGDPSHELAQKYLPDGAGGMVVFGVRGGSAEGIKRVDTFGMFCILANVGDAKSLIIHPASTTHSQLSDEDRRKAGLTPELVRLSIGLEPVDDIIAALDDALALI